MTADNESDDLAFLNDFANLEDIIRKPEVENANAEFQICKTMTIPVVVTEFFDSYIQLRAAQSKDLWKASHDKVRLLPDEPSEPSTYQVGDQVEIFVKHSALKVYGWAASTIQSIAGSTYVAKLRQQNSLVLVQKNKLRPITETGYLHEKYIFRFEISVPVHLQKFAKNIKVHQGLLKAIGDSLMHYDTRKNVLVIFASNESSGHLAQMLRTTHFANLTHRMLLQQDVTLITEKFERMKNENFVEQFKIKADVLKFIIGKSGQNIKKAEQIKGITCISVLKEENTVRIHAQTKQALDQARACLKLEKETVQIHRRLISRIIGKNGKKIVELTAESQLYHIIVNKILNEEDEYVNVDLIGVSENIAHAKILLKYHIEETQHLATDNDDIYQQSWKPRNAQLDFGRQNQISEKSSNTSMPEIPEFRNGSTNGFPKTNQNLVFYRGGRATGRGTRTRGRPDYQTTLRYGNSSGETTGASRGRGRGCVQPQLFSSQTGSRSEIYPVMQETFASTSDVSDELERQRSQGAISKHMTTRVPDKKKNTEQTSQNSNNAAVRDRNSWLGKKWCNRYHLRNVVNNPEYSAPTNNLNKSYYRKGNPNGPVNGAVNGQSPRSDEYLDEDDKL